MLPNLKKQLPNFLLEHDKIVNAIVHVCDKDSSPDVFYNSF